jgi:8-oxo-dGTP diphosphatase
MSALRLGVQCAVIDDHDKVLLSRRGDLNIWNLPGGRLDSGELLADAAIREVCEETGVVPHIERAVGLYYLAGWERLNVLYAGWPLGGNLQRRTRESRANQYFVSDDFPDMLWEILALDTLAGTRHKPRILQMPSAQLHQMRLRLRWRWAKNLLAGRPEPGFPDFNVSAVGVIWEDTYRRVLTFPNLRGNSLPRVRCDGESAPWEQLAATVYQSSGVHPAFRWVGVWQDAGHDRIEFIFAATVEENGLSADVEWSTVRNAGLGDRDTAYIERVKPTYARDVVWSIAHQSDLEHGETIGAKGGSV